ncbi:glycoside hydrolase superfamily [Entophlyctis helioformis]|nr:glycoside hydrolase superfamily [Entophlyctis helioformis]
MANRALCGCLFTIKALLAFLLGLGGLGIQAFWVYKMYGPSTVLPSIAIPPAGSANAASCFFDASAGKARLEPPLGTFVLGFSLNWAIDTPEKLVARTGKRPAIYNTFIRLSATDFQKNILNWNAQEVGKVGAMLEVTLMPVVPVETIPSTLLWEVATFMREINSKYGVPVFLRYGHEMNGPWMIENGFGMRPIQYKQSFATLASYIYLNTNLTAMVWSPNVGNNYPFGASAATPGIDAANLAELDTNKDGLLSELDNPYDPFYPGDAWVDWIGISVYNYRYTEPTAPIRQIIPVDLNVFSTVNEMSLVGGEPGGRLDFYGRYAAAKRKPFIFSETGSAYQVGGGQALAPGDQTPAEVASKRAWWNAIFQGALGPNAAFKNFHAAVWFEEDKVEQDSGLPPAGGNVWRDYRITYNTTVLAALNQDLDALGNQMSWAGAIRASCNGTLSVK